MTVISTADGRLTGQNIVDDIARFLRLDDVYGKAFARALVIQMPEGIVLEHSITSSNSEQYGLKFDSLDLSFANSTDILLPSGPYFVYEDVIYEAWRLYPDNLDAFEFAVIPEPAQKTK